MTEIWRMKAELERLMTDVRKLRMSIDIAEQERRQARLGSRLPPHQHQVLAVGVEAHEERSFNFEEWCVYRRHFASSTGLNKLQLGRALGALRRLGFISLHHGLMNEDGQLAGSGYSITAAGLKWWREVHLQQHQPS